MRKTLFCLLLVPMLTVLAGCPAPSGESTTKQKFEDLYKEYANRFHEKMVGSAETMQPVQVTAEAARIWNDVFGPHKDLVEARVKEILADLDQAEPFDENLYLEVASGTRVKPTEDEPQGIVVRQFLWSPVATAQMALNTWLARLLQPKSFQMRQLLTANAGLFWQVRDRDINHPKLILKQGPMIFTVDLSRHDDYYQVDKIRWLRPKSMGPLQLPEQGTQKPAEGTGTTPAEGTGTTPAEGADTTPPEGTGATPDTEKPTAEKSTPEKPAG